MSLDPPCNTQFTGTLHSTLPPFLLNEKLDRMLGTDMKTQQSEEI